MSTLQQEYRGYMITLDETTDKWYILVEYERHEGASLSEMKTYIDRLKKKSFERIPVWVEKGWNYGEDKYTPEFVKAFITSISPSGDIWISRETKGRGEKARGHLIYADTPANRKLIEEYHAAEKKAYDLNKEMEKVKRKFKEVDTKDIRKKVGI